MSRPSIGFNSKSGARVQFESFKLEMNDLARIAILDQEPVMELVHWVNDNGYIVCLGDYDTVMGNNFDEKCPICRAATPGRQGLFPYASRRFGVHVIRYVTDRKNNPIQPVSGSIQVWRFGEDKFGQLITIGDMYDDLTQIDLSVKCTAKLYQKLEIQAYGNQPAAYLNPDVNTRIMEQFREERVANLSNQLGRRMSEDALRDLVDRLQSGGSAGGANSHVNPNTPEAANAIRDLTAMSQSSDPFSSEGRIDIDSLLGTD